MRIFIITLFLASLFCNIGQNFLNVKAYAFGIENDFGDKLHDREQPRLLVMKEGKGIDFIYEKDIIIIPDDVDNETEKETSKKEGAVKKKKKASSLDLVLKYIEKGKKYEARNMLSDLYFAETNDKRRSKIKEKLDRLNAELVFSMKPSPDSLFYTVKPGDSLVKIASKFDIPYRSIMRINNKSRSLIRIGERLKILKGNISLLVDKSDFTLTVLLNGYFIKQYSIGIGMYDKTPEEVFFVKDKLKNPVWYSPEGVYPYGNPKNVLGTRWMGFEEKEGLYGYGIHGTTEPKSIGKAMSNGCIRLKNEDVEELYDFVEIKTKVVIQK